MGDDFFEDQPVEAPSEKKTPQKASDTVKKSQPNKSAAKSTKPQAKAPAAKPAASDQPLKIDVVWVAAFVVVAFVAGFFVRGLFITPATTTPSVNDSFTNIPGAQGGQTAPPLEEGQLQEGLPQGHPSIGGETTQSGAAPTAPGGSGGMGNIQSDVPASGPLTNDGQSVEVPEGQKNEKQ